MAKKINARQQIKQGEELLLELMQQGLTTVSANMISSIMKGYRASTPSTRDAVVKNISTKGQNEYKSSILDAMASLSLDGIDQARTEVPAAKKVKLDDIDKLPNSLKKKLKARADSLVGKQVSDIEAELRFAYLTNSEIMSEEELAYFLTQSASAWVDGTSVRAGASITSATIISEAREAFFFEPDVLEELDAFIFVNGDPVTEVCQDLAGTVFDKNDPDLFRYTPPLHWNCKSSISPILKGDLGNRTIEKLQPSTKEIEDTIQFAGCTHHMHLDDSAKQ